MGKEIAIAINTMPPTLRATRPVCYERMLSHFCHSTRICGQRIPVGVSEWLRQDQCSSVTWVHRFIGQVQNEQESARTNYLISSRVQGHIHEYHSTGITGKCGVS